MTKPKGTKRSRNDETTAVPNNSSDDLVLLCPVKTGEQPTVPFKLQARRLAAMSNVFDSMLQDSAPTEQYEGLPVIRIEETADVMGFFLAPVYNQSSHDKLLTYKNCKGATLLGVWEAANKYEALHLRAQASEALSDQIHMHRYAMATDPPALLDLAIRAELFNDRVLTEAIFARAGCIPWSRLPKDKLRQLSFEGMHSLTSKCFRWVSHQVSSAECYLDEADDDNTGSDEDYDHPEDVRAHTARYMERAADQLASIREHLKPDITETSSNS